DFLGDDRGIKRLSLVRVGETPLRPGPVVAPTATVDDARAVMAAEGTDWVVVCDGPWVRGWLGLDDMTDEGGARLDRWAPRAFRAMVDADATLKAALDVIVTSRTRVAVAVDGGAAGSGGARRYLGMLTVDDLA